MLTLYLRPGCSYCERVMKEANALSIGFDLKNIENPTHRTDLIARGGKQQVPYLVDPERGVEMYESEDIARYLHRYYAPGPVVS